MTLSSLFYRFTYRFGKPGWDSLEPRAQLKEFVQNHEPGRALELGCGTGTDAIYLASEGWLVTGVDFVPEAIATAKARAKKARSSAVFVVGDVSHLDETDLKGPVDLVIDIGCFHGLSPSQRVGYANGVAVLARPGADYFLAGISDPPLTWRLLGARGLSTVEVRDRFGEDFDIRGPQSLGKVGRRSDFGFYHLVRKMEKCEMSPSTHAPTAQQ